MRIGGWGAVAVGAGGIARLGIGALVFAVLEAGRPRDALSPGWTLLLAAVALVVAAAQLATTRGTDAALGPPTPMLRTVAAGGVLASILSPLPTLLLAYRNTLAPGPPTVSDLWIGLLAAFATALWVTGVCAADWRLRRLPTWLRVVGAAFALLSFAAAIIPPLALLTVPLALIWWFGLGAALLRSARGAAAVEGG